MHDKSGNELRLGDTVMLLTGVPCPLVGPLAGLTPAAATYNVLIATATMNYAMAAAGSVAVVSEYLHYGTASEVELVRTGDARLIEHGPLAGFKNWQEAQPKQAPAPEAPLARAQAPIADPAGEEAAAS